VTELEERAVPATLFVNLTFQWYYTASAGVQNNFTIDYTGPSYILTDSAETINVSGIWGAVASGSGTHQVTIPRSVVAGISVDLGDQSNQLNLHGTNAPITINNQEGGSDFVTLGSQAPNLGGTVANILQSVSVSNSSGSTVLKLDDSGDTTARTVGLYDGTINGLAPASITWTPKVPGAAGGVAGLNVLGGDANNSTWTVFGTSNFATGSTTLETDAGPLSGSSAVGVRATSGPLWIDSGYGFARVLLCNNAPIYDSGSTLANINGTVFLYDSPGGFLGQSSLEIHDDGDFNSHAVRMDGTSLSGLAPAAITWSPYDLTSLSVTGGTGNNTWNVAGTSGYFGTSLTFRGNDTINVGDNSNTLNSIQGPLSINVSYGTQQLNLNDNGQTSGQNYTLAGNTLTRPGMAPISFDVARVALNAGSGNDSVTISSAPTSGAISLDGSAGSNTLAGPNTTNTWMVKAPSAGTLNGIPFTSFQDLVGGTGVDTFKFTPSGAVSSVNGGGAPAGQGDWLNYAAFPSTRPVTVNLATGSATNVASGATGAVQNIQNVIGGAGTDTLTGNAQGNILIGGAGTNLINGGSGRSLLIGGKGPSTIKGGAGDDILIAGTTSYDANETALMNLLGEWQRTDKTYAQRISDLRTGGSGTYNGSAKLIWGKTVVDNDTASAKLTGGPGLDWFFANLGPGGVVDTITDRNNGGAEQVN
jgi:hypothetical protein